MRSPLDQEDDAKCGNASLYLDGLVRRRSLLLLLIVCLAGRKVGGIEMKGSVKVSCGEMGGVVNRAFLFRYGKARGENYPPFLKESRTFLGFVRPER